MTLVTPASSRIARRATSPWVKWIPLMGGMMVIAAPLLIADLPQLGDYLNHLARMYVIGRIDTDPVLARIYEVVWGVVPNLAMDLIVPPLSHVIPLDVAGRLFITLALLLPVAGVVALHRSAFGGHSV
jgi:hypothetical protein